MNKAASSRGMCCVARNMVARVLFALRNSGDAGRIFSSANVTLNVPTMCRDAYLRTDVLGRGARIPSTRKTFPASLDSIRRPATE